MKFYWVAMIHSTISKEAHMPKKATFKGLSIEPEETYLDLMPRVAFLARKYYDYC